MKKYTLRAASERAVLEALTFYIEHHRQTLTQNKMRPFLIARKEIKRQTFSK